MHVNPVRVPRAREAGGPGCTGARRAAQGPWSLSPAVRTGYKLADRPECTPFSDDEACTTSEPSRGPGRARPATGDVLATRAELERLYRAPLDWSRGFPLVTLADGGLGAGGGGASVLAAQQQQQQQQQKTPPDQRERSPDYYANVGDAIRTLREDIPLLFDRELNLSIYRDDVVFRDPRNSFAGIKNYKTIFWSLRFHGRIFFTRLYVEVKRIWQSEDGCIRMRWTVHGVPRVPWEAEGTFDGVSQYKLDREGKIYEHAVDNVILRDPPVGVLPWLFSINLQPAQQQVVPGAFFQPAAAGGAAVAAAAACEGDAAAAGAEQQQQQQQQQGRSGSRLAGAGAHGWWTALLARFSWVRFYAASIATMQLLQQQGERLQLQPAPQQACADR